LREARDLPSSLQVEVIEGAGLWEVLVDRDAMAMALLELVCNAAEAMADGGRLTRDAMAMALLELVCNAAEAMADGGRLTLETANVRLTRDFTATRSAVGAGDYVRLTVRDNGPGLSTELADRALNPFFTSKSETGHEGLGLSVVYGVVCQSGGHMEIDCGEGEGFKVDLYIPRMAADDGVLGADVHVVSTKRRTTR
jgi:signal transduction histidine kinase